MVQNPQVPHLAFEGLQLIAVLTISVLIAIVICGLIINFLLTLLQVQEQSLPTAAKILTAIAVTGALFPWMGRMLSTYVVDIFDIIGKL